MNRSGFRGIPGFCAVIGVQVAVAASMVLFLPACQSRSPEVRASGTVREALLGRRAGAPAPSTAPPKSDQTAEAVSLPSRASSGAIIATVNGLSIERSRVVDLLLASHGVGVLEQLMVHDLAERQAHERSVVVTPQDIADERDRSLRQLADPLGSVAGGAFDRDQAERLLDRVLADRNVSRAEFDLVIRRNALLRALVLAERTFTDDELREEYSRTCGPAVSVRHLQVATTAEVARVQERLAGGADFAQTAQVYSAHEASARRGGLLDPFTRADDRVPEALRLAAFGLKPGEVSGPIRVGEWYHLLKLEERRELACTSFEVERRELERRLRDRFAEPAMRALYENLFREATIRIHDPVLDRAFRRVHEDRFR